VQQASLLISIDNGPEIAGELTVETERIDVTTASKSRPDMGWEYIDASGHFHAWSDDKDSPLPTLDRRTEHVECDFGHEDDCEGYDVDVYSCSICGEIIEPKRIVYSPVGREYRPGRTSWTVVAAERLECDRRVSLKLTSDRGVFFGVGVVSGFAAEDGGGGVRFETSIHGVSPLGHRKAMTPAAA